MSGAGQRAFWGAACALCSVPVVGQKGLLAGGPGGWAVLCGRCEDMSRRTGHDFHQIEVPPPTVRIDRPPSNAHSQVWLRTFEFREPCHCCVEEVTFAAGVFPLEPARSFNLLVLTTTDTACRLVKHLFARAHLAPELTAALMPKPTLICDREILTIVCPQCGAPYPDTGDSSLRKAVLGRSRFAMTSVASAPCSVVKWHRALYDPARTLVRI